MQANRRAVSCFRGETFFNIVTKTIQYIDGEGDMEKIHTRNIFDDALLKIQVGLGYFAVPDRVSGEGSWRRQGVVA